MGSSPVLGCYRQGTALYSDHYRQVVCKWYSDHFKKVAALHYSTCQVYNSLGVRMVHGVTIATNVSVTQAVRGGATEYMHTYLYMCVRACLLKVHGVFGNLLPHPGYI